MKINKLFQALQLLPFFITGGGQRKTKTTAEVVLRSALEPHVCSHLNIEVTVEFSLLNSTLDSLAHEINLRQYRKEFIWTSPDDRAAVEMRFGSTGSKGETNKHAEIAASPPLCLTMRSELHFSLGSSLDLAITAGARPQLDADSGQELLPPLWVKADKAPGGHFRPQNRSESKHSGFWMFVMICDIIPSYPWKFKWRFPFRWLSFAGSLRNNVLQKSDFAIWLKKGHNRGNRLTLIRTKSLL